MFQEVERGDESVGERRWQWFMIVVRLLVIFAIGFMIGYSLGAVFVGGN